MNVLDRKGNTIKGTATGLALQAFYMVVPFILKTVFIYTLGIQYSGLNSLFTSILQVLNLAELGVGYALVFSMYKPIAEGDTEKICALMRLYRLYYRIIGVVILVVGCAFIPVLPVLIAQDLPPDVDLTVLYLLNLGTTVLSYWLFAYKNCILSAHQKTYVTNIIRMVVGILTYIALFAVLLLFKNYYAFLIVNLVSQIVNNIVIAFFSQKLYPQYTPKGSIEKEERKTINKKVASLFAVKVNAVITNAADSIVLSSFLGLTILGIYNNYYYILTSIMALFTVFYTAFKAGLGNALITESTEKNVSDFYKITFMLSFMICIAFSCFLNLFQPFITLWLGKDYLLGFNSVILLTLYFLSYEYPLFWAMYKDAAGKWKEDMLRSIIAPLFNLVTNIILVNTIGINGVILSTVATYGLISGPWLLVNLKKHILAFSIRKYLLRMLLYIGCTLSGAVATYFVCSVVPLVGVWGLLIRLAISVCIPAGLFVLCFFKTHEFKESVCLLKTVLHKRKNNQKEV
ncbi:MAG: oligosaccharide flippase family protein [Clostridia bacterium]|nr:oligosaccharide flippase family protein [Clostridia bacterium]